MFLGFCFRVLSIFVVIIFEMNEDTNDFIDNTDDFTEEIIFNLGEEVDELGQYNIYRRTRVMYRNSSAKFIVWLKQNCPSLIHPDYIDFITNSESQQTPLKMARAFLSGLPQTGNPINFELVTARIFLMWMVSLRKADGAKPGTGVFKTHRSALFNLFRGAL